MGETKITKDRTTKMLKMERVFDAPRDRVWRAFTTAEINKWWGPRGWETITKHLDFSPGGYWHYCMKCIDENQKDWYGQESWGKAVYKLIDQPNKFVYEDQFTDAEGNVSDEKSGMPVGMTVTVEFFEEGGKTRVVSTTAFADEKAFDQVIAMGVEQGIAETWDRLAEYLQ